MNLLDHKSPQLTILRAVFIALLTLIYPLNVNADSLWTDQVTSGQNRTNDSLKLLPDNYRLLQLNDNLMKQQLGSLTTSLISSIPSKTSTTLIPSQKNSGITNTKLKKIQIPLPDGSLLDLLVSEYRVMAEELASKYPDIQTYRVESKNNNGLYGVLDFTLHGFHAMLFMKDGSRLFIDPRNAESEKLYISYFDKNYHPTDKEPHICNIKEHNKKKNRTNNKGALLQRNGDALETYRLAMAATGEYTTFHGGTIAGALAAMATTVNRVNSIYERDLAIKLELVANNNLIVYTNAATDPYTGNNSGAMINQNQTNLDSVIKTLNYDIGHVVSTGGAGLAGLGVTCSGGNKARGVTGIGQPVGDPFDIDFVSHEIGHQFGGTHTFNGTANSCGGGNRTGSTAFEPGSGATIMAYAGICGSDNLQPNSDAMFHIGSINQMSDFINGGGNCGADSSLNNIKPVVNAGLDFEIPANTPFELIGSATDVNGDVLTYSWEQVDAGQASAVNVDTQDNAIFRSFLPISQSSRTFPKLSDILSNITSIGEILPAVARTLNFSLAVRDGKGAVVTDNVVVNVNNSTGFKITSHNTPQSISTTSQLLTWDVAGTGVAPINCTNVELFLSTDGGNTFINSLGSATPNDGSENILIPIGTATSNARFKIKCQNNIFFDISDADLAIDTQAALNAVIPVLSNLGPNNAADPGETISLDIPLINQSVNTITNLNGTLSSTVNNVVFPSLSSTYPDLAPNQQAANISTYELQVPQTLACGAILPFTLDTSFNSVGAQNKQFNFNLMTGVLSNNSLTNSNPQNIPDNNSVGINSIITVSNIGVVSDPNVNIDINITHTYNGDLAIKLTSPSGTIVQLKSLSNDSSDNHIGNYPNTFTPVGNLSAFNGENFDGNWTLNVSDGFSIDTGTLNQWSINFVSAVCDDNDLDNDGVNDDVDNCPNIPNPDQLNTDFDAQGNACDQDDDNDGIDDTWEIQFGFDPLDSTDALLDGDNDGVNNLDEFLQGTNPLINNFITQVMTRAEIAKPLLQAMLGNGFNPLTATGDVFTDVAMGDFNAAWIEKLLVDEITEGCTGILTTLKYCPKMLVTKEQLAKVLLKAKFGSGFMPPVLTVSAYSDVPLGISANWIGSLLEQGFTDGCAINKFCPNDTVTYETFKTMLNKVFP